MDANPLTPRCSTALDLSTCTFAEFDWNRGFRLSRCPNGRGEILLTGTGEIIWDSCRGNRCGYCVHVKSRRLADAIAASGPTTFWTLTQVGSTWEVVHQRVRNLRDRLSRSRYRFEWAWVVEQAHVGSHVHALVRGQAPSRQALSQHAQGAGMGHVVDVRPVDRTSDAVHVARYLLKGVTVDHQHHLELNGGQRLLHTTRSFWHADGRPVGTMREAVAAAARRSAKPGVA